MARKIILLAALVAGCSNSEQSRDGTHNQTVEAVTTRGQPRDDSVRADTRPVIADDTSSLGKVRADAARRGIDFRAVGQEPGWLVEIDEGKQISILADYGEKKFAVPAPVSEKDAGSGTSVYRVNTPEHHVTITIRNTLCHDGMSGLPFETTVTMMLDGTTYQGCGERIKGPM